MDGLKARLSFDAVAYDYDDEYLTIDTDTHTININNVSRLFGVQYDGNSKLIKFRIRNKLSDIQKMQDSIVYINWIDSKGVKGQSIAINKTINNDTCEFSWKVPFDALKNSGVLHFAVSAVVTKNSSSVIDQRWSTKIASVITPDGIYIKSYTPSSEEEDRIAQIYNELSNMINKQNDNLQSQVSSLKEDLDNLREIEFYPNLLNKAEFLTGKQMAISAGSTPDDLVDNENTTTTNVINCDGDEYFETNLPNGHTVILAYLWYQEKWYRSQFISSLEVEGNHFKFKINAQMKKIRIYCTSNMMPANPILTKQGEYDESKPEFFPKGKIKLAPSGCVGYDNLDEDTKQRINKNSQTPSDYLEIPFRGKKIVGIGDSIMVGINSDGSAIIDGIDKNGLPCTDQGYQINSTGGFLGELRKKYPSINVVNMGVGSTTMQRNDNVNVNKVYKCIMDRIDNIPDDADIIILEGGINDFFHASKGCVLGTYKDSLYKYPTSAKYENGAYSYVEFAVDTTFDASTFCGALEIALTKILVRFVGKPFIYVIPHNPSASADIDTFFDSAKAICEKYGVPVVDIRKVGCMPRIYTLSGKTDGTSAFTQDGVHPNPLGYQLHYVPTIASTLKSIM